MKYETAITLAHKRLRHQTVAIPKDLVINDHWNGNWWGKFWAAKLWMKANPFASAMNAKLRYHFKQKLREPTKARILFLPTPGCPQKPT